ncbi:MAG: enoyl-CoA hydratase/isomerase family protein [Acidimicrobiia bacterium]
MTAFVAQNDIGSVRTLTLSNPGKLNAVPPDGWLQLEDAFLGFAASTQQALVLTGADGAFCAGADMAGPGLLASSAADTARRMREVNRAAMALHRLNKPTIAAVDGVAVGAGMNLAIGCDVVIASSRARFAEIFVQRGLTMDFGGTWHLPRLVGLMRARELALTGRIVDADEALDIGLVLAVVEPEVLSDEVMRLAGQFAAGAPLAQSFIKRALDRSSSMNFEQTLSFEEQAQVLLLGSEDCIEGAAAFVEKRDPRFKGR